MISAHVAVSWRILADAFLKTDESQEVGFGSPVYLRGLSLRFVSILACFTSKGGSHPGLWWNGR
jgi:hypothetical protein